MIVMFQNRWGRNIQEEKKLKSLMKCRRGVLEGFARFITKRIYAKKLFFRRWKNRYGT